jgi:hypothetical protein
LCRRLIAARLQPTSAEVQPAAIETGENNGFEDQDLMGIYEADWANNSGVTRAPEWFDISEQPPTKKARADADQAVEEDWEAWAQSVAASYDDIGGEPSAAFNDIAELVELDACGEAVKWPEGWSAQAARQAVCDRPRQVEPPRKRVRPNEEGSVRASIDDSAFVNASVPVVPNSGEVQLPEVPGHPTAHQWKFGSGHDLRLSGRLIWCRKCGRYGEEGINKKGVGGDCRGERVRIHTQYNLLRQGLHTRTERPIPPDVAFQR